MANLTKLEGHIIGKTKIVKRVENYEGASDSRTQYLIRCLICHREQKVVGRDLVRYKTRFDKGCYKCSKFPSRPKEKFKYGRNANGFIDKKVIIKL